MSENIFTSTAYNQRLGEHTLMGTRCSSCGAVHLPPRPICPHCLSETAEWVQFSGKGKVAAFTSIYIAPTAMIAEGFSRTNPYCSAVVQLVEGPMISAQILGVDASHPETIRVGLPVEAAFIERGEGEQKRTFLAFQVVG
ncbi:MAG: Zn-ribbon domain-containing OB-fold protein [Chloroflexota bacterium]|nr:MAG: Zn-ribbon domain-containing OB-fold protein [Chloroflexota bacterium]